MPYYHSLVSLQETKEVESIAADVEKTYGGHGVALVRSLSEHGHTTFSIKDAREAALAIGLAPSSVTLLLHRIARAGLVQRLKRGTYSLTPLMPGAQQRN